MKKIILISLVLFAGLNAKDFQNPNGKPGLLTMSLGTNEIEFTLPVNKWLTINLGKTNLNSRGYLITRISKWDDSWGSIECQGACDGGWGDEVVLNNTQYEKFDRVYLNLDLHIQLWNK